MIIDTELFLKIFVSRTMNPNDTSNGDQSHRGENHHAVVLISMIIAPLGNNLTAEKGAASKELTEESYNYEYDAITKTIADAVKERCPWAVAHCKGFKASHDDTVGYDKTDEHGKSLADFIVPCFQYLIHNDNEGGNHHKLYNYTNGSRYGVAQQ